MSLFSFCSYQTQGKQNRKIKFVKINTTFSLFLTQCGIQASNLQAVQTGHEHGW